MQVWFLWIERRCRWCLNSERSIHVDRSGMCASDQARPLLSEHRLLLLNLSVLSNKNVSYATSLQSLKHFVWKLAESISFCKCSLNHLEVVQNECLQIMQLISFSSECNSGGIRNYGWIWTCYFRWVSTEKGPARLKNELYLKCKIKLMDVNWKLVYPDPILFQRSMPDTTLNVTWIELPRQLL
jgi:hypothetical protein